MVIAQPKEALVSSFKRLSATAAVAVGVFGVVILIGRLASIATSILPSPANFKSSTAVSFAVAGASLWYLRRPPGGKTARWMLLAGPALIFGIGLMALSGFVLGWNQHLHDLLLRLESGNPATLNPLVMPPVTAFNFLLVGFALALFNLPVPRRYVYSQCCTAFAGLQSLLFLMQYAYTFLLHGNAARIAAISLPKTLVFLMLTVGVLFARPECGVVSVITDNGSGGRLLRRGLLITMAVPFMLCWLGMAGRRGGYYSSEFGLALVAASIIGVFATLIWGYARSLMETDSQRKRAENFLNGQKQVFEMISKNMPLRDTLSSLVKLMEQQTQGFICSVLLLDRDGVHLRHGAAPSLPAPYMGAIDGAPIGPVAGSCGTAAFRGQSVLVKNIATDPLWADYKQLALPHGLNSCWSTPIVDENHKVLGTFAIYDSKPLEITPEFSHLVEVATYTAAICIQHHAAAESLRESVLHLSMVYDSVADVIFRVRVEPDGQFRFDSVNPAFYGATGFKEGQVVGKLVQDVIPEPSLSLVLEKYRLAISTRKTVRWEEETRFGADTRSGDVSVTPIFDAAGNCIWLIGSVHDVTERKRLEQQVRQSQKMEVVGQLAGGVAHDFNNLLTVINGYSELLLQGLTSDDANRGYVEEIERAGEHAASLTHQLLAFSRRQVLKPQVLSLNKVVGGMEKMLRRLIGAEVELITHLEADLGSVRADSGQMEQIILNLVVNARDAMPTGGKLVLETSNVELDAQYAATHITARPGPHVMLAASDTGLGMDAETQKRIFEPFFTTKEVGKGTGLGLSTVYGIVKQSEGNIWVYSEPGIGTTFKIYLPRVDAPVETGDTVAADAKLPGGTETILLVEDEPSVRMLIRTTLESNGYQVLEANNGAEGLLIAEQHPGRIHFLLTDLVMPGISGRILAEQMAPLRPELKVLFLSGYTDDVVVRYGALDSNMAFLQKPFTPDALARKVREVMDTGSAVQ